MAVFDIAKIKPPFPKGRIHVFRAGEQCILGNISVYVNATEPKDIVCFVAAPGKFKKDAEGNRVPKLPETKGWKGAKFQLKAGDRLMFVLNGYPNGIEHIDLHFTVTRYTGKKDTGHEE